MTLTSGDNPSRAYRPLRIALFSRLVLTPAPFTHDRLGRPLEGPCLIWSAAKDRRGYGVIGNKDFGDKKIRRVHRVMYELFNGPGAGELDHLCRVPACASPAHLEEVTHAENVRRGDNGIHQRSKTHCKRGHEFTPENTGRQRHGRYCRTCNNDRNRAQYDAAKRRARYLNR
jgi:HNH endonuclease